MAGRRRDRGGDRGGRRGGDPRWAAAARDRDGRQGRGGGRRPRGVEILPCLAVAGRRRCLHPARRDFSIDGLALAARGAFYLSAFQETMGSTLEGVEIIPPTQTVTDQATLDLGHRQLQLVAWKTSHSDCDLTIMDQTSGTLFAGDLLFLRHVPVVDGSLLGFLEVAEQLAAIPAKRVVPGHGPAVADWPNALNDQRSYLLRLTADLRSAIRRGSGVSETVKTAGRDEAAKWNLFENYNARNATTGYAELEWENAQYAPQCQ